MNSREEQNDDASDAERQVSCSGRDADVLIIITSIIVEGGGSRYVYIDYTEVDLGCRGSRSNSHSLLLPETHFPVLCAFGSRENGKCTNGNTFITLYTFKNLKYL